MKFYLLNCIHLSSEQAVIEDFVCICALCQARIHWKQSVEVVFTFSSKTRVLVWCGLKQAENEPKTTHVCELGLSLPENAGIQIRSFSASFQAENDPVKNPSTGLAQDII